MAVTAGDDDLARPGPGGVFCRTVSSDAAQSALCSSASLWWEVARATLNGCSVGWTAFAAPTGTPVVHSRSACRMRWRVTAASTVWTHGLQVPYCRGREAATPPPLSGSAPGMAPDHVRVRSAARATLVACLQGPPPDASEDVWPQASEIQ